MSDSEQKLRQALMKIAEAAQAAVDTGQYMDEDNGKPHGETARRPRIPTRVGKTRTVRSSNCPAVWRRRPQNHAMSINPMNRVNFGRRSK